jgi:hypothetical protein
MGSMLPFSMNGRTATSYIRTMPTPPAALTLRPTPSRNARRTGP